MSEIHKDDLFKTMDTDGDKYLHKDEVLAWIKGNPEVSVTCAEAGFHHGVTFENWDHTYTRNSSDLLGSAFGFGPDDSVLILGFCVTLCFWTGGL